MFWPENDLKSRFLTQNDLKWPNFTPKYDIIEKTPCIYVNVWTTRKATIARSKLMVVLNTCNLAEIMGTVRVKMMVGLIVFVIKATKARFAKVSFRFVRQIRVWTAGFVATG